MKKTPVLSHAEQVFSDDYDLVVVGAGPGGIAASIQAARSGLKVALFEETDWVGGQMTAAGVGTMDEGHSVVRKYGLYKEFVDKVTAYYVRYSKSVNTCYYDGNNICVEPKVGQEILRAMLEKESKNLSLFTTHAVTSVLRQGNSVGGVMANGRQFKSKVVIDASEYGDVIDKAGAEYRIGNGTCTEPKQKACIQSISYVGIMKQYPSGVPASLTFTKAPPGYTKKVSSHFAKFITPDGNDHSVKPKNPLSFRSYLAFRGLPDLSNPKDYNALQKNGQNITRTALIAGNDYPIEGVLSARFLSDDQYRKDAICKAKLLTIQLAYYIQQELGHTDWSLANDSGYDTSYNRRQACANLKGYEAFERHLAVMPYVREGKRLIGAEVLTGRQLQYSWRDKTNIPRYADSIGVGYYPMDVHNCKSQSSLEPEFDSASDWSIKFAGGPFEVPIGVLIPEKIDGLLAAEKNISASRLANGAIREQPIAMSLGQAAGALAAQAIHSKRQLREIKASTVRADLERSNVQVSIQASTEIKP